MLIHLHPVNPQPRQIKIITECLLDGGIIIYPTDTQLSFVCSDLSDLSKYTQSISTPLYRTLKKYLPGPYTFILHASSDVPKILHSKKRTIGLRIPDNVIANTIVKELGHPILSASLPGEVVEESTDPELIYEKFGKLVDIVIDGGPGGTTPSTIIDCTSEPYEVIRQGLGEWEGVA
jgi:tRNA threonylcarbamoyl adenosine modification protein (Sua5/YciO/YrdC/YwlC family)